MDISIIVPIKDESGSIPILANEIMQSMSAHTWSWECIWVDDGSTDNSLETICKLCKENSAYRYISFDKNYGQSAALYAGFAESRGRFLATLDGDGQNDPADIPSLIAVLETGEFDMVNGFRKKREDSLVRTVSSRIANTFRNITTGKSVRDTGCSSRAFKKECVEWLPLFKGMHRFLPTVISLRGFKLTEMPVNHRLREKGESKYSINNRLWVGLYDIFGIMWLRKRFLCYKVDKKG
jgi:glycosyltransferase involved in cell wall biosynthesis